MDFNSHMRNTAYLDKAVDVRQMFLIENGITVSELLRLRVGPVVGKDEVEYFREVGLLETIEVTLAIAGHAPDGSRFKLRQEIIREDGVVSAKITSSGGWLDLDKRKLVAPPEQVLRAFNALERTDDYEELRSSVRK